MQDFDISIGFSICRLSEFYQINLSAAELVAY